MYAEVWGRGTVAELTFASNPVGSHRETIVLKLQATGGSFIRVLIRAGLEHGGIREETGSQTGYIDGVCQLRLRRRVFLGAVAGAQADVDDVT